MGGGDESDDKEEDVHTGLQTFAVPATGLEEARNRGRNTLQLRHCKLQRREVDPSDSLSTSRNVSGRSPPKGRRVEGGYASADGCMILCM